jgi:hypothetical protein
LRKATKSVATWFGVTAGIAGIEHGYFEIMQGNNPTDGVMIASIGPPCLPEEVWNACEPALTIVPNYLVSGILSILIGFLILIWSAAFIQRKRGGTILILLSLALLLFGGGIFPPMIGIAGGIAGTRINKPLPGEYPSRSISLGARFWPWPLVIFLVWIWGQWVIGYYYNDFLQGIMPFGLLLILIMMPFSLFSGYSIDKIAEYSESEKSLER